MTNRFSVLMPVYHGDCLHHVKQAVESILILQSVKPDQLVIVRDGGVDSDLERFLEKIAEDFDGRVELIKLDKNVGLGEALNVGLNSCSFDLVARMDADDICHVDRFKLQLSYFDKFPDVDILGTAVSEFVLDEASVLSYRVLPLEHDDILSFSKSRCPFNHPSVMYKKSTIKNCGGYDAGLALEDYRLWARAIVSGAKCANLPEFLVSMRAGSDMLSRRGGWKYLKSEINMQVFFYNIGFVTLFEAFKYILFRAPARFLPVFIRAYIYSFVRVLR